MPPTVDEFPLTPASPSRLTQPAWVTPRPRLSTNVGLRAFMVILVYFAVAFLAGRAVWEEGTPLAWTSLGVWLGLGMVYAGTWLVARLGRLALAGWLLLFLGQAIATSAVLGVLMVSLSIPLNVLGIDTTATVPLVLPGPLAWPAILIFDGVVLYLRRQHRLSQQGGLLWVLALASDRGIPLAPGVEAYAQQHGGTFRTQAHALAELLAQGEPLGSALEAVPRVVPWDAPILIRVGEQTGQLAGALRTAVEVRARRHHALRDVIGRVTYLIGVLVVLLLMTIGTNWYIVPPFGSIFTTIGVGVGPLTTRLFRATEFVEGHLPWLAAGLMLVLAYLSLSLGIRGWAGLPVVGRLFRLRHQSLILRCLALAVSAGQPIDPTVTLLARHYPSRPVRRRLRRAGGQMAQGIGWTDALQYARLIRGAEVGVLDAAGRAGNLAWALGALADVGERRFAYRLQWASQILFALALLGLAVVVLFVALALFVPLVDLIEGLVE